MRILFVDDEPAIRETMPAILARHGFEVDVASNVPEALSNMHSTQYDVLISDLNIGEPGDGFTVVSAMHRTQPNCRNIILTGYPGFESALQAIRNQVDDYLMKPTRIDALIEAVERETMPAKSRTPVKVKPLSAILREHHQEIMERALQRMKDSRVGALPLSDAERISRLPEVIEGIAASLETNGRDLDSTVMNAAAEHGRTRFSQGYSLIDLLEDTRALDGAIYDTTQDNLLTVDLSTLMPVLKRINEALNAQLKQSLLAYTELMTKAG